MLKEIGLYMTGDTIRYKDTNEKYIVHCDYAYEDQKSIGIFFYDKLLKWTRVISLPLKDVRPTRMVLIEKNLLENKKY